MTPTKNRTGNRAAFYLGAVALLMAVSCIAWGTGLTAVTLCACDDEGTVIPAHRYNSGPIDGAWDLFLYEGKAPAPAGDEVPWLNSAGGHTLDVPLAVGTHTFTFYHEGLGPDGRVGLNLFFNGNNGSPAISAMTLRDTDGPPYPECTPNRAERTMGWPITDVHASGTLSRSEAGKGLWTFSDDTSQRTIMLKDFRYLGTPATAQDLVGPHEIGASGVPDCVGQFTLEVTEGAPQPTGLFLWLQTCADTMMGAPDMRAPWKKLVRDTGVAPPFSFVYGGKPSSAFINDWKVTGTDSRADGPRIAHTLAYTDPETGLEVRWEGVEHPAYKTVEWTLYFTNTGSGDTPIVSDIQALDVHLQRGTDSEFALHYNRGDSCDPPSFEPLVQELGPGKVFEAAPSGGRPTNGAWPYWNLRAGSEGVIVAAGWPGQWAARFARDEDRGIHLVAGQQLTHFTLHPGEKVRTPLIVLQFSQAPDWLDAQNTWRRWMIDYNIPHPNGQQLPLPMFDACSSHQFAEMTKANEQCQIEFIDSYLAKGLKIDYWWMDAGWYVGAAENGWPFTGTWEVDRRSDRFPNGLRAISDHAHAKGVKIIVWFEPERVAGGTWLTTEHPEWVLGGAGGGLLNLGDPEAWKWLVNHIDRIITDEGIDLYRQDFNIDPLSYWRGNDPEDRQGITENKHVMGYLAYWDELLRRHPGLLIDSCASGGRRNDIETMRRAVPLLRSDYLFEPVGQQNHTYGLSYWLPFYGTGYNPSNGAGWGWGAGQISYGPYARRSNMCPANIGCFDFRLEVDDELILKLYHEWLEIAPNYFGDYYPLTSYSLNQDVWSAVQFNRPATGMGHVQAFRRENCIYESGRLLLRGLDPDATYTIKDFDTPAPASATGRELMEKGLLVTIPERPGAATILYRKETH
ncbi:MAG TPA: alpha-galactosidase [Candidatus Hydrogenedentes bacterium]|nr:alpha-galactosidase [Candidatus Hydrogenedentota bacterium]